MASRRDLYVGRAGQLAVMAELLLRGYNVAIPEVDVGDDVFVVRDRDGDLQPDFDMTGPFLGSRS